MIENNVPFVIHLVQIGVTDYPFSFSVQRGEDCLAVIETVGEISSQVQFVIRDSRENTLKIPADIVAQYVGKRLLILRSTDLTQRLNLKNQGRWTPEEAENAFDKLTLIAQELKNGIDRSIKVPLWSEESPENCLLEVFESRALSVQSAAEAKASAQTATRDSAIATQAKETAVAAQQEATRAGDVAYAFFACQEETFYLSRTEATIGTATAESLSLPHGTDYMNLIKAKFAQNPFVTGKIQIGKIPVKLKISAPAGVLTAVKVSIVIVNAERTISTLGSTTDLAVGNEIDPFSKWVTFSLNISTETALSSGEFLAITVDSKKSPMGLIEGEASLQLGSTSGSSVTLKTSPILECAESAINARDALLNLTAGQTTTLAPGIPAVVTVDKSNPALPKFNFAIPKGEKGLKGERGTDGEDGNQIYSGTLPPASGSYMDGEGNIYIHTRGDYQLYQFIAKEGGWIPLFTLRGPQGKEGEQGIAGTDGFDGKSLHVIQSVPQTIPDEQKVGDAVIITDLMILTKVISISGNKAYTKFSPIKGDKGDPGAMGSKGDKGDPGIKGEQGLQGIQGATGAKGDKGDPGIKGEQGLQGIQGATGAKGDKGDPGIKGEQGLQGIQGATGAKGDKGDPGIKGEQGLQGIQGATGAKGDKGDRGTTDYNSLTNKPSTFSPSAHTQAISTITGLQPALDEKINTASKGVKNGVCDLDSNGMVAWDRIPAHLHNISEIRQAPIPTSAGEALTFDGDRFGRIAVIESSSKGVANGVASLDANAKIPMSQIPEISGGGGLKKLIVAEGMTIGNSHLDQGYNLFIINGNPETISINFSKDCVVYFVNNYSETGIAVTVNGKSCFFYNCATFVRGYGGIDGFMGDTQAEYRMETIEQLGYNLLKNDRIYYFKLKTDEEFAPPWEVTTAKTFMLIVNCCTDSGMSLGFGENVLWTTGGNEMTEIPPPMPSGYVHQLLFTVTPKIVSQNSPGYLKGQIIGTYIGRFLNQGVE